MRKGKFIVIEGIDGSGKGEQFKLLLARLKREGFKAATFDFPQYGKPSAFFRGKIFKRLLRRMEGGRAF